MPVNNGFRFQRNKCTKEKNKITWHCFRKDYRSYLTTRKFDVDDVNTVITVLIFELPVYSLLVFDEKKNLLSYSKLG